MKKIIIPLMASAFIFSATNAHAEAGFTNDKIKKVISKMDDDKNQKVGFDEYYEETVTDNHDSIDRNKDGYITADEVQNELTEELIETVEEMKKHGVSENAINRTVAKELVEAEKQAENLVWKMDSDGDNLVEPHEYRKYKKKQFSKLDRNQDGVISKQDLKRKRGFPIRIN